MPSLHKLRAERDGERDGRMEVFREGGKKKFDVSSTRGSIENPCSPQRVCSDTVHILETGPVLPTRHVKDRIVGNTEQGGRLNEWSSESHAWSRELVPSESHK